MKKLAAALALSVFAFAGCAATAPSTRSSDPSVASLAFPKRVQGGEEMPQVRRFNRAIETEHAGQVKAGVKVCVTPGGNVATAELVSSSGLEEYDQALVSEVESWKYEPFQAPAEQRVCQTIEVSYNAG